MLAAISHDLRTPLTLLRLRTENVADTSEREKMLATIAEMDAMVGVTLQFARDEAVSEPRRATDLAALLQSIVDDMGDAGMPVKMEHTRIDCAQLSTRGTKAGNSQSARQCREIREICKRADHEQPERR